MKNFNHFVLSLFKQRLSTVFVNQNNLDKWSNDWNFFFILGFGRSGTAFLANLLGRSQNAHVFHEPVAEDFYAHLRAHYGARAGRQYISGFRKKEIYSRMRHFSPGIYGEVNSILRCHAEAIKEAFPGVVLIHLVRDGRDVVRSTMPRRIMTLKNPFSMFVHPSDTDAWRLRWAEMDRFARICWYWQEENSRLRKSIGKTIHLEDILSNYEFFRDAILVPCRIDINKKDWENAVTSPRNTTKEFSMPKWDRWTPDQQKTFREICGEEMEKCGYAF